MSKRKSPAKRKRTRRKHSAEFKQEAVKLVFDQQLSVAEAARNLGIQPGISGSRLSYCAVRWGVAPIGGKRKVVAALSTPCKQSIPMVPGQERLGIRGPEYRWESLATLR